MEAIESVPMWRSEFQLTIRGPSSPTGYAASLTKRVKELGLTHRVFIEDPVPATELVSAASLHDVGFVALPGYSQQNQYALPNKVFEYMMAGLALVLSDLTEMRRVVAENGTGILMQDLGPDCIANTINSLDRDQIDAFKRASLSAAKLLHWEVDASVAEKSYAAEVRSFYP